MNILQTICWSIEVQKKDVTSTIIENCQVKARILNTKYGPKNQSKENDLGQKNWVKIEGTKQKAVT